MRRWMAVRLTPERRETLLIVISAFWRRICLRAFSMRAVAASERLRVWAANASSEAWVAVMRRFGGQLCAVPNRGRREWR